jgi:hypothetical protein
MGKPDGSGSPSRCRQTIQPLPPCSGPPLASFTPGPPQRASIPVLALEAQPPTGLPSRPTCRGAGPLQVLKAQDSQATPGRPARPASLRCLANSRFEGYRDSKPRSLSRSRRKRRTVDSKSRRSRPERSSLLADHRQVLPHPDASASLAKLKQSKIRLCFAFVLTISWYVYSK